MPATVLAGHGRVRGSPKTKRLRDPRKKRGSLAYPPSHRRNSLLSRISDPRANAGYTGKAKKEANPSAVVSADDVTFVLLFRDEAPPQFGWIYDGHPLKDTVRENDTLAKINGESAKGFTLHDFFRKLPQNEEILVVVTTRTRRGPQTVEIMFGKHRQVYEENELKKLNPLQIHRLQSGTFTLPSSNQRQFVRHNRDASRRDFVFQARLGSPNAFNVLTPRGNMAATHPGGLEPVMEAPRAHTPDMKEVSDDNTGPDNTSSSASFGGSDRGSREFLANLSNLDPNGSWDFDAEFSNWKATENSKKKMAVLLGLAPELSSDQSDSDGPGTLPSLSARGSVRSRTSMSMDLSDHEPDASSTPPRPDPSRPPATGKLVTPFVQDARRYSSHDAATRALERAERRKPGNNRTTSEKQPLPKSAKARAPMRLPAVSKDRKPKIREEIRKPKMGPRTKSKALAEQGRSQRATQRTTMRAAPTRPRLSDRSSNGSTRSSVSARGTE